MILEINWHDASENPIDYRLTVEAEVKDGERATLDYPGSAPEVNRFFVRSVEFAVCYPGDGKYGFDLLLTRGSESELVRLLDEMLHADEPIAHEKILDAWERETCAA
jgi:hypothetical protein